MTGYAGGLRISEIINLKIKDIDSERMVINIRNAKGKKDRQVSLSPLLLKQLRIYYKDYHPRNICLKVWMVASILSAVCNRFLKRLKKAPAIKNPVAYIACAIALQHIV